MFFQSLFSYVVSLSPRGLSKSREVEVVFFHPVRQVTGVYRATREDELLLGVLFHHRNQVAGGTITYKKLPLSVCQNLRYGHRTELVNF